MNNKDKKISRRDINFHLAGTKYLDIEQKKFKVQV